MLSPLFWQEIFQHLGCLVPATSFCEPHGKAPARYYWFGLQREEERPPFAFARLWRTFRGFHRDEAVELDTFTIITTKPNAVVEPIHPTRMPVTVWRAIASIRFRPTVH